MRYKKTSIFLVETRLCSLAPGFDYKMYSGWIISVQVKCNSTFQICFECKTFRGPVIEEK